VKKLFAWPFDPTCGCDDGVCSDDAGFRITGDRSFEHLFAVFAEKYEKDYGEPPDEEWDVAFYIVSEDTYRAASAVPLGEWDAETMRYTGIRKGILEGGAIETVVK